MSESNRSTKKLTLMAMLAAMAYIAMLVTRPLPQVAGFLSFDLKDVVVVLSGFMLGPLPALLITLVVSLLEMVTVSTTGFIGLLMNVLSTGAFALPPAIIYRRSKSLKSAAIGLAVGVVAMTALMLAWNYIITPLYMKVPREVVAGMLIPTFLPFNLVKGGLNAGIAILVYKPVTDALRRAGLLMPSSNSDHVRRFNLPMTIAAVVLVITCAIVFALMSR
ncbi:MAG: ECF transporter S component [Clostridia bacterium]|nr:ECF transporter S component [Clostridia bacterium]